MDKQKVKSCLALAFGVNIDSISDETSQVNLPEWDSLKHLNMIVELELEFEVDFDPIEIGEMNTFEKVCKILTSKLN